MAQGAVKKTLVYPPPLVATLPTAPFDGQEVFFVADAATGVLWHLRYNANWTGNAWKWEFVGGSPLTHYITTQQAIASATFGDLGTVGPTITTPLNGSYRIAYGAAAGIGTANYAQFTLNVGGALVSGGDEDVAFSYHNVAASQEMSVAREAYKTAILANVVIKMQYRAAPAGSAQFSRRWMDVFPLRVG